MTSAQVLTSIETQRESAPLSILHQVEPLSQTEITPGTLSADLAHYRDLFSKLRFSYLEQVTKEKYLRGIVGEPPQISSAEDNAALEERVGVMKGELQAKKRGVEELVVEIEGLAGDVALRKEKVDAGVEALHEVPREVAALEAELEELRALVREREGEDGEDERLGLGMEEIEALIVAGRAREEEVRREVEKLQAEVPARIRECEEVERELEELERRRNEVTRAAREARRIKEEGGRDVLEEQGRWYKSSEVVLQGLLGIQS